MVKNLIVPYCDGERQPVEERRDGDAAAAGVALGVHVAAGARVVELRLLGVHQAVSGAALAEVDARLRDLEARRGAHRRDVLHEEVRRAVRGHLVHGAHRHAEAVRVGDVLVDPRLRLLRQPLDVELARREHGLAVDAVDRVAVHVGVEERCSTAAAPAAGGSWSPACSGPRGGCCAASAELSLELLRRERLLVASGFCGSRRARRPAWSPPGCWRCTRAPCSAGWG